MKRYFYPFYHISSPVSIGNEFTIKGHLSGEKGSWVLIENPTSKSRVSFILEVPENLSDSFEQRKNEIVTINETLSKVNSTWKKEFIVNSIE